MRDLKAALNRNCLTNYRDCQTDAGGLIRERSLIAFLNQGLNNGYGTLSWRKRFVILLLSSVLSKVTDLRVLKIEKLLSNFRLYIFFFK